MGRQHVSTDDGVILDGALLDEWPLIGQPAQERLSEPFYKTRIRLLPSTLHDDKRRLLKSRNSLKSRRCYACHTNSNDQISAGGGPIHLSCNRAC